MTVVLPGLIESPPERLNSKTTRYIDFRDVFQTSAVESSQKITYMSDLKAEGWNGQLDVFVSFYGQGEDDIWFEM